MKTVLKVQYVVSWTKFDSEEKALRWLFIVKPKQTKLTDWLTLKGHYVDFGEENQKSQNLIEFKRIILTILSR